MYEQRALVLFNELRGHSVGGWQIRDLIRHGKSAAVFIAHQPPRTAALKIFDPELVARYGVLTQLTRINRELSLRERHHPNLVEIYDGGQCPDTGYHFLVMQYLTGDPLSIHIPTLPRTRIPALLQQMASAAKFLEDNNLVHRDIKPDNVVIHGSTGDATLLDLGVLRPINSDSTATDDDEAHHFVGTLQYSPPEFLLREEEDTVEGWRAVTFYQLGAVLHDLIERRSLFADLANPYARLVNAVQHTPPQFHATDVPNLVHLAENCLVKSPDTRLQLVTWDDFAIPPQRESPGLLARQRLTQARHRATPVLTATAEQQPRWHAHHQHTRLAHEIEMALRQWCVTQDLLPPVEITTTVAPSPMVSTFSLHFRPDTARQLHQHLLIHIEVHVLDLAIRAIELLTDAALVASPPLPRRSSAPVASSGARDPRHSSPCI